MFSNCDGCMRLASVTVALGVILAGCAAEVPQTAPPAASAVPRYVVDRSWPQDLPNDWVLGEVAAVSVDQDDQVWILHRPASVVPAEGNDIQGTSCCVPAPSVLQLDPDGNVLQAWGGPGDGFDWPEREHGLHVDHRGDVWLAGNGPRDHQVVKFSHDGEFLLQIGEADQTGGSNHPDLLGHPASFQVDPVNDEVYIADGYLNRRVVVYDATTGAYKRHWGAYGNPPEDVELPPPSADADPISHFHSPVHDVALSADGLVYVADRSGRRVQIFMRSGEFVSEVFVRERQSNAQVGGLAVSKDSDEQWLYLAPLSGLVTILDRRSLEVVNHFGGTGDEAGHFRVLHDLDVDSQGNVYTAEAAGRRAQKFIRLGG